MEARRESAQACDEEAARVRPSEAAAELFERGAEALRAGRHAEALEALRAAHVDSPEHAGVRSLLGVAIAHAEGDFEQARAHCEEAARREFFNPETYLNLARVYLRFGRRAEALRYVRRGQMIDPGHAGLQELTRSLGRRRLPIVPFLPRRHPVNRALGAVRSRFASVLTRS